MEAGGRLPASGLRAGQPRHRGRQHHPRTSNQQCGWSTQTSTENGNLMKQDKGGGGRPEPRGGGQMEMVLGREGESHPPRTIQGGGKGSKQRGGGIRNLKRQKKGGGGKSRAQRQRTDANGSGTRGGEARFRTHSPPVEKICATRVGHCSAIPWHSMLWWDVTLRSVLYFDIEFAVMACT